ncbi:MAG TPA: M48 family metalloprotease [Steroidobacteraceae bacterium]|jgi:predicted Zn-dependent protease|nr:M48 family metalloprotease [Steroidobacteraceae bacterium]
MRRICALFGCFLTLSASYSAVAGDPPVVVPTTATPASFSTRSNPYLGYDLPDLGGPANALISKADEYSIGRMVLREVRDSGLLMEDPEVTDYIQQLGMRLASQAHDEGQSFTYNVMKEPVVNAGAIGRLVLINSGLILMTDNESELASVVAHETGHIVQRHMARAIEAQSHMSLINMAAMLAAIALGAMAGGGQGAEGAIALTQAASYQQQVNLIRGNEIEADAVGIELLAGAGFDPNEMANEFELFSRMEGLSLAGIPPLLIDHPVTSERVAAARNRAATFPPSKPLPESLSYELFKERVRVLALPPEEHVDQYYSRLRDRRPLSAAERYGEALVQMQNHNAAAAVAILRELVAQNPQVTMLYATLGQALVANNQMPEALEFFRQTNILFPRNVPLTVRYAETLMQANRAPEAHTLLLDLFNNADPTPAQIRLTALAANAAGDAGDAYEYMAEYDLVGGQLALANQQLELALATPGLTGQQKAKFRARLEQVRGWLREQQASRRTG